MLIVTVDVLKLEKN